MREARDDLDLAKESLRLERRSQRRVQHLDGDEAVVLALAREIHGG
jgi:hypothetical protein